MYDLENLNVVIGNSHNEGEENDFVGLTGGPDSPNCENSAERNYYSSSNSGENEIRGFAGNGHSTSEIGPKNTLGSLTGEINQRISEEVNVLIDTSNLQIQRATNEAINDEVQYIQKLNVTKQRIELIGLFNYERLQNLFVNKNRKEVRFTGIEIMSRTVETKNLECGYILF